MFNLSKKSLIRILVILGITVVLIDLVFLDRHSHFSSIGGLTAMDGITGFYAILSFFGTFILFKVAQFIYNILSASEDYYHDDF
ncbi:MAG: hypothetical protein VW397_02110 [Candidatus Margulisiibacteriota bacterium]